MNEIIEGTTLQTFPLYQFDLVIRDEAGRPVATVHVEASPSAGAEIIKWAADAFKEDHER